MPQTLQQRQTIERWTDALRSGKYAQTTLSLHQCQGYCCLGVLLDVLDPQGWRPPLREGGRYRHVHAEHDAHAIGITGVSMPDAEFFSEVTGLSREDMEHFAGMNDNFSHDFASIADEIEVRCAA